MTIQPLVENAIRAFDVNAIDYLLKPYTEERFMQAIEKIKCTSLLKENQQERIESLLKQVKESKPYPERIFIRSNGKVKPVLVGILSG
jgi:two-component system LytT family response regulator